MDIQKFIYDYLSSSKLMQIATAKDNKPWVCSVWFVHDDKLNLYWISKKTRRHSQELLKNSFVAGAIVMPHVIGSGEKVRGLQFEGEAQETHGESLEKARSLYLQKYETAEKIPLDKLKDPSFPATFYIICPRRFVLFDEVNFPDNPRQELLLED